MTPDKAVLAAAGRRLLGPDCHIGTADIAEAMTLEVGDFEMELQALGTVSDVRRAEFLAGRLALRRAQRQMGVDPFPVLPGHDRAPIWPPGLVGSLSHAGRLAVAVLCRAGPQVFIGVDLEDDAPLNADLQDIILLDEERRAIHHHPDAGRMAKLIFACKEAIYKAQYPVTEVLFGFDRVRVEVYPNSRAFVGYLLEKTGKLPAHTAFCGRYTLLDGLFLCVTSNHHPRPPQTGQHASPWQGRL